MWMVANYVASCPQLTPNHMRNVLSTCQETLSGLPHDHCARYLAHILAGMQILLGAIEEFRRTLSTYPSLFTGELQSHEYFPAPNRHLLAEIPEMGRLLEENRPGAFKRKRLKMRLKHLLHVDLLKF